MEKKYYILGGILVLLLVVAGFLFVYGSGGGKPKPQTGQIQLTWWKTFEESGNVQEMISDYQATHKNVTISFVKKNISDYETELVNAIAAGTGPDIFSIHNDWLPKHSDKIFPMPSKLMSLRSYNDSFVDVASADFVKDSQIFAVPLSMDVLALYYNKDLLNSAGISQPPTTWPALVSDVQKLTKVIKPGQFERSGVALGTASNVNRAVDILTLLMLQNGTKIYSDGNNSAEFDRQQNFGSSQNFNPGEAALKFYIQFADPAKTSYTWNAKSDFSVDAFTQGKVAMMISYSYMTPTIKDKAPNLNWGIASVPQAVEDSGSLVNFANYWGETVSKTSKNQAAAWDFINFISQKQELGKYYAKHKLVSSRKDMLPDQYSDTEIGAFAENALTARSVYKKDANVFETIFSRMIDDVVLRNTDAIDALRNAAQQINLNLQQK